jgi:UDP-N-acetylglucosamine 1-carboxyvinyltransferase
LTSLIVDGGRPLAGSISPSANKNAVLPVLCATLLTEAPVVLRNVPDITDVRKLIDYFEAIGSEVRADLAAGEVSLRHSGPLHPDAARLPAGMRSTVMLIPALLHRFGRAVIEDDSKGCTLGIREIDPHVEVFRAFGASIGVEPGGVVITAPDAFRPARHWLDYASVTTTENFLMCAALAGGRSRLINAACEPHVQEFSRFLALMGVQIDGVGTSTVEVEGGALLDGAEYAFVEDFHEVATFLALGAITGGEVRVRNSAPDQFQLLDRTFAKFGLAVTHEDGWSRIAGPQALRVQRPFTSHMIQKVEAAPWPYVPADLLPIFIALGARADGSVMFWNKVYEGALGWTSELTKFGVQAVTCDPHRVIIFGGQPLSPATLESPYIIRAAIALLMVAASVDGRSVIVNADPIRRAHPNFVENLRSLGADIRWE